MRRVLLLFACLLAAGAVAPVAAIGEEFEFEYAAPPHGDTNAANWRAATLKVGVECVGEEPEELGVPTYVCDVAADSDDYVWRTEQGRPLPMEEIFSVGCYADYSLRARSDGLLELLDASYVKREDPGGYCQNMMSFEGDGAVCAYVGGEGPVEYWNRQNHESGAINPSGWFPDPYWAYGQLLTAPGPNEEGEVAYGLEFDDALLMEWDFHSEGDGHNRNSQDGTFAFDHEIGVEVGEELCSWPGLS